MTPRLICCEAAAAYCGVTAEAFDKHVRPHVLPLAIGARRLWDVKALDRWLDEQSGLTDRPMSVDELLAGIGDDRAHQGR